MSEANREVVRRYADAFNRGDLDGLCRLFAPDAVVYGVLGWGGIDQVRPVWKDLIDCFRINLTIDGLVAEGDVVAARYVERGTSVKPFRGGSAATGKSYEIVAMEWFEIRDGLIRRRWGARDSAAQARQMGLPVG